MKPSAFLLLPLFAASLPAMANGVGENVAWQFRTTAEAANRAYIEDLRLKRVGGSYSAPNYTYNIATQNNYNCSNAASSSGNGGSNTATANTPKSDGPSGSSAGNQNTFNTLGQDSSKSAALNADQDNTGEVSSNVTGDSMATASQNDTRQVLNTKQINEGEQTAMVQDSQACAFAGPASGSGGK